MMVSYGLRQIQNWGIEISCEDQIGWGHKFGPLFLSHYLCPVFLLNPHFLPNFGIIEVQYWTPVWCTWWITLTSWKTFLTLTGYETHMHIVHGQFTPFSPLVSLLWKSVTPGKKTTPWVSHPSTQFDHKMVQMCT